MTDTIIIILLLVLGVYREWLHYRERQDLYDRIMCKDVKEYKHLDKPPPTAPNSKFVTILHKNKPQEKGGD